MDRFILLADDSDRPLGWYATLDSAYLAARDELELEGAYVEVSRLRYGRSALVGRGIIPPW